MAELEGTLKTWQKKVGDGVVVDEEVEIDKLCLRSFIVASSNATRVFEPGRLYKPQACLTTAIHRRAAHGHGSCGFPSDHSWQRIYDLVLSPHSLAITLPNNLSIARVVPTLSGLSAPSPMPSVCWTSGNWSTRPLTTTGKLIRGGTCQTGTSFSCPSLTTFIRQTE
jgi:hypothetical protein